MVDIKESDKADWGENETIQFFKCKKEIFYQSYSPPKSQGQEPPSNLSIFLLPDGSAIFKTSPQGHFREAFMAMRLDRIQDITCGFGISGGIFGPGNIIIESAGTEGKIIFEGISSPQSIKGLHRRGSKQIYPETCLIKIISVPL